MEGAASNHRIHIGTARRPPKHLIGKKRVTKAPTSSRRPTRTEPNASPSAGPATRQGGGEDPAPEKILTDASPEPKKKEKALVPNKHEYSPYAHKHATHAEG